jgi:hypothetical protein|tara:strand:- start:176 stop:289 length:114 start_codon:yes stop_codon:yes gene_type:complete
MQQEESTELIMVLTKLDLLEAKLEMILDELLDGDERD